MIVPFQPPAKQPVADFPIIVQRGSIPPPPPPSSIASSNHDDSDWHAKVLAAIDTRFAYLQAIEAAGDEARQLEMRSCAADPVYWINNWVWTGDPRKSLDGLPISPMVLWAKQVEYIRWLQEREATQTSGLVEKSRDAGATWLTVAYVVHAWLFRPSFSAGFASRDFGEVDQLGNPDTIFEKIRFLINNLPVWMLPKGFKASEHCNLARIVNPANGSTITGEGGKNIGHGGRKSIFAVDESARLEHPELVDTGLSFNTNVRIDISTPNGAGNPFFEKRFGGTIAVFVFDFRDDPRKNKTETLPDGRVIYPWYEEQKKKFPAHIVASQVDRDYLGSIEGVCIPAQWVRAAVGLVLPKGGWGPTCAGLDVSEGDGGPDYSVWIPRFGPMIGEPVAWKGLMPSKTAYRARDLTAKHRMPVLFYDRPGPGIGIQDKFADLEDQKLPFRVVPVRTGLPASEMVWPDGQLSSQKFVNIKAELWWIVRTRFERTYEFVTEGTAYPPEDLISLPDPKGWDKERAWPVQQLIQELSSVKVGYNEAGKVLIESKKALKSRGIKSPDFADALVLCFQPVPRKVGIW